jgi:hypothetical protein
VEEREDGVDGLLRVDQPGDPGAALQRVGQEVAVGEDGALRDSRCPTGVLQEGDVSGARPGVFRVERARLRVKVIPLRHPGRGRRHGCSGGAGLADREPEHQALDERKCRAEVHRDHVLHRGVCRHLLHRRNGLVPHDRHPGAVVSVLVLQLLRGVERVVLDDDRPEPQDGVERNHVLRTVRQHQGDPVARLDAHPAQRLRCAVHAVAEHRIRGRGPEEVQRHAGPEPLDRSLEQVDQRLVGHLHRRRDSWGVAAQPRPARCPHGPSCRRLRPPRCASPAALSTLTYGRVG